MWVGWRERLKESFDAVDHFGCNVAGKRSSVQSKQAGLHGHTVAREVGLEACIPDQDGVINPATGGRVYQRLLLQSEVSSSVLARNLPGFIGTHLQAIEQLFQAFDGRSILFDENGAIWRGLGGTSGSRRPVGDLESRFIPGVERSGDEPVYMKSADRATLPRSDS